MKVLISVLFLLWIVPNPALAYTADQCKDIRKIAAEFIDAELAGVRYQGASDAPSCLGKLNPSTMQNDWEVRGDEAFLAPEFTIRKGSHVDFQVVSLPDDLMKVIVHYKGASSGKLKDVNDSFVLKINSGKTFEIRGCASLYSELAHFVMFEDCVE